MRQLSRSSTIRWAGGLVVLAVACAITPRPAAAECGSYVIVLNSPDSTDGTIAVTNPILHLPSTPCHGPNCSNIPTVPFTPLPTTTTPPSDTKMCTVDSCDDSASRIGRWRPDAACYKPFHQADSVFHPPRA
jgi:hypothetical protein